jgi:hypothetical protein
MHVDHPSGHDLTLARPRFCRRCLEVSRENLSLCPSCGESLVDQGYCGICESYWTLPEGEDCPKHEVPLEAGPPKTATLGMPGAGAKLVTIGKFARPGQAEALRIRLEAEGIPTFLQGERMGSFSMYQVATGGVALQVPEPFADDARIVVSQTWTPPIEEEDLDDAWEELAPEPGARRRAIMKGLILVMLLGPPLLWLIASIFGH